MSTEGAGTLLFEESGSTFTIKSSGSGKTLANWQGTGRYVLHTPEGARVSDPWGGDLQGQQGFYGWLFYSSDGSKCAYEPIYDYSSGVPKFTGQWLRVGTKRDIVGINVMFNDATPFLVIAGGKAIEKLGAARLGKGVGWVGVIWTVFTLIDDLFVSQDQYFSEVWTRPTASKTAPAPLWAPNPNGLDYPYPGMPK